MRKKIFVLLILLLVSGCFSEKNNKDIKIIDEDIKVEENLEEEKIEDSYVDDNPIIVGLYENDFSLVDTYVTSKENSKDIVFGVYYTNVKQFENRNQKYNWQKYYDEYSNIDNYKIGFCISFDTIDGKIEKYMLDPSTEYLVAPYLYMYLYDDIHQPDGIFYSHVTSEDFNENTIFSSIKLYLVESQKITSSIFLTVFTYDSQDDFDNNGNYRGNSKYTIEIKWNN